MMTETQSTEIFQTKTMQDILGVKQQEFVMK